MDNQAYFLFILLKTRSTQYKLVEKTKVATNSFWDLVQPLLFLKITKQIKGSHHRLKTLHHSFYERKTASLRRFSFRRFFYTITCCCCCCCWLPGPFRGMGAWRKTMEPQKPCNSPGSGPEIVKRQRVAKK